MCYDILVLISVGGKKNSFVMLSMTVTVCSFASEILSAINN